MRTKKTPAPDTNPTFEQAMERLEQIVADMESGDLPLEQLLQKYEEGSRLVKFCGQKLEEAEQRIELLAKKGDTVELKPFPAATTESDNGTGKDATLL